MLDARMMAIGWARSRRHARALTTAYNELLAELAELRREVAECRAEFERFKQIDSAVRSERDLGQLLN